MGFVSGYVILEAEYVFERIRYFTIEKIVSILPEKLQTPRTHSSLQQKTHNQQLLRS